MLLPDRPFPDDGLDGKTSGGILRPPDQQLVGGFCSGMGVMGQAALIQKRVEKVGIAPVQYPKVVVLWEMLDRMQDALERLWRLKAAHIQHQFAAHAGNGPCPFGVDR